MPSKSEVPVSVSNLEAYVDKYGKSGTNVDDIIIPDFYFSKSTFSEYSNSKAIYVGESAFILNRSLQTLDLSRVKVIGNSAFQSCYNLNTVNIENCEVIGRGAFKYCSRILSMKSAYMVHHIKYGAFQNARISMSSGDFFPFYNVEFVDGYAFAYCSGLTKVQLPDPCYVGDNAFYSCPDISFVDVGQIYLAEEWGGQFGRCSKLTHFDCKLMPVVPRYTFNSCSALSRVSVSFTQRVLESAFAGCVSLKSLDFATLQYISNYAFENCTSLSSIYLRMSWVPYIEKNAFYRMSSFSIFVPSSMISIYKAADGWSSLSSHIASSNYWIQYG